MNTKKKRSVLILLLVLVVLFGVYFGMQAWNKNQEKKQSAKEESETIYVTDYKSLTGISYDVGQGKFTFAKEDDAWTYTQDKDFPLAQTYPKQMETDFAKMKAERELDNKDSLADYGLEEPAYTVELTGDDGSKTEVYFGNAVGDDYYVTTGDKQKVFTVSNTVISDLQYGLDDMAQLDTFPTVGSGNLKKETVTQNGTQTVYDSENTDDEEKIAAAAGGLGAVTLDTAADYSVDDKDLAGYGLDEGSRITVEVNYTKDKKDKTLMLYIGSEDGSGNRYIMMNDSRIVYLISNEVCGNITQTSL